MKDKISYMYAGLAVLLWSSSAAVGKIMLSSFSHLQLLLFASFFAMITLFFLVTGQKKWKIVKKYKLPDYLYFVRQGFLGIFLYYMFFYKGLSLASAQEVFIINYTWPLWVALFLGGITFRKILALFLSFFGVLVVVLKSGFDFNMDSLPGYLYALAGAACYGLFSVISKKNTYEKVTATFFCYLFAFVLVAIVFPFVDTIPVISLYELFGLLWLGIFTSGLAFVCWLLALEKGDGAKISNIAFLTPFLSLVWVHFLLGDEISIQSLIGLILIIGGIILQFMKPLKK